VLLNSPADEGRSVREVDHDRHAACVEQGDDDANHLRAADAFLDHVGLDLQDAGNLEGLAADDLARVVDDLAGCCPEVSSQWPARSP
jgi:hypothetical protein